MRFSRSRHWAALAGVLCVLFPLIAKAADTPPLNVLQAIVWVQCDTRQGSGTVINGNEGFVLTSAHIVMDVNTKRAATSCIVGFLKDPAKPPTIFYHASIERYTFQEARGQDFAILQIQNPLNTATIAKPFPSLKTAEFPTAGDMAGVYGFSAEDDSLVSRTTIIDSFFDGFIKISSKISPGDSGGAALDANFNLIGIPTRIVTFTFDNGQPKSVSFELVDIRAIMNWLDTYGLNFHDRYFTHADFTRYHQNAVFINQSNLGCSEVVRTRVTPTVFCLLPGGERLAFPNSATFLSWFPDFVSVDLVIPESLSDYALRRNVTHKPGTLIKSATSPSVYVVVDGYGALRWIPTEDKARTLWGPNWANLVHDIPDEFWINYTIGQPLDI